MPSDVNTAYILRRVAALAAFLSAVGCWARTVEGFLGGQFAVRQSSTRMASSRSHRDAARRTVGSSRKTNPIFGSRTSESAGASKGFGTSAAVAENPKKSSNKASAGSNNMNRFSGISQTELKDRLLDLVPRMTGTEEEFRDVEDLVNALEERYQPAQTLQFLNFAMRGEWQLIFSTNLAGTPNPSKFRLRELFQRIECRGLEGSMTNVATWDLAESGEGVFDATGSFSVKCRYTINQGARMVVDLEDHVLQPSRGSSIPRDVPALVGLLHRAMPKELFDPSEHAVDTTYLDDDLRIVRYTGPRLEGIRDIMIRRGTIELDAPTTPTSTTSADS